MIKFFYKKILYRLCLIPMLFAGVFAANAQSTTGSAPLVTVSGIVKDKNGPLPGASVVITGTTNGTPTNNNGKFSITVESGKIITIRMIGYITEVIKVTAPNSNLVVELKNDQHMLKDAVVIGYQEVSRRSVTAAITSLDPKL